MKRPVLLLFCLVWSGLVTGPSLASESVTTTAAPLIFGVFPRRGTAVTTTAFEPIARYLSAQLARPVVLETSRDWGSFWANVERGRYDLVHFNQYHYVVAHARYGYQAILQNEEFGSSQMSSLLLVRKDSNLNQIIDLKGKTIAFGGDRTDLINYIGVVALLKAQGLNIGDYQEIFAKNPANAVFSTYYQKTEAAGTEDGVMALNVVTAKIAVDQLKTLARGEALAHLPWAVKGGMAQALSKQLQAALLALNDSQPELLQGAHLTGIRVATDSDFDAHRRLIAAALGEQY